MSVDKDRIVALAALYASPDTEVPLEVVAWALARCENFCRERRPAIAYSPEGSRAIVAPFGAWLKSLGYRGVPRRFKMPVQPRPSFRAPCSLYLASQADQYKIGISEDPVQRAATLCTSTVGRPVLVAVLGCNGRSHAEHEEGLAFEALAEYRRLGEWFDRVYPVVAYFESLQGVEFLR